MIRIFTPHNEKGHSLCGLWPSEFVLCLLTIYENTILRPTVLVLRNIQTGAGLRIAAIIQIATGVFASKVDSEKVGYKLKCSTAPVRDTQRFATEVELELVLD